MPDPTTEPDPINPIDAATAIVQQIVTITARAKSRDQRIADLHTDTSRQHPLAPDQKVFDHVVAVAEQDAQSLEADMRAADALASNLIRALESEADRTSRLPTDADALAGTKGETVQATLLARLLDATVRASVEAWLPTLTPAALLAWYRATADEQDAPRVREGSRSRYRNH